MDTILKKATIFLFLSALLFGCKEQGPQLPDPDTMFPTPEPEPAYIVIDGDTIPVGYSKTIDDLARMLSIDDNVDLLTIHGTSGAKVWKKFYASVLKAYVMDELASIGDVTISNPTNGQAITWNGSAWVNTTLATGGDVTTAQLADSTAAVRGDFPTPLTEEQVEDFVGGMVTGNTETLITVTYDDNGGVINFVVESNLSNYTNDAGFLTAEVDADTTNEIQTLSFSSPNISISGGNSVDISAIDTDTQLTDEQVQDIIGAMLSGNTETLITVTYDDNGAVINFVVDNDLSNYDNSTSGFLTAEVDADTTNELITSTSISGDTITITDAGSTQTIVTGAVKAVVGVAPSGGTQTIDLLYKYVGTIQIDLTSASSPLTLTVNNPVDGGNYRFHAQNASSNDIVFPAAFLNVDGTSLGTVSFANDHYLDCYFDGTNYHCSIEESTQSLKDIAANSITTANSLYTMTSGQNVEFRTSGSSPLLFLDETNDRIGIGTNTLDSKVNVLASSTSTGSVYGLTTSLTTTPTASKATASYGANYQLTVAGSNANQNALVFQAQANITGSSTANIVRGFLGRISTSGAGSATRVAGGELYIEHQSSGLISSAYGLRVLNLVNSGAGYINNTYGIYIGDITAGTQTNPPYAIYSEDTGAQSYFAGKLGLGQTSPTSVLHLKAGTATANTAPLKINEGTNLATPEDGAIEHTSDNLHFTAGSTRYTLAKTLTATSALDFGSTTAQNSADLTITVTGAADGDAVSLGVPNAAVNANSSFTAWVSAANTVTVRFNNYSSSSIDPASGTFRVSVIKY